MNIFPKFKKRFKFMPNLLAAQRWRAGVQVTAIVYHYTIAGFLWAAPAYVTNAAPLYNLTFGLRNLIPFSIHNHVLAGLIFLAALAANVVLWKINRLPWLLVLLFLSPQLWFLFITLSGEISVITAEHYPDGTYAPMWHIAADQCLVMILAVLYTLSMWHLIYTRMRTHTFRPL